MAIAELACLSVANMCLLYGSFLAFSIYHTEVPCKINQPFIKALLSYLHGVLVSSFFFKTILSNVDLTEEQINKICFAIEFHEEYNWNGKNVDDINTLILQDADNLDAIGAIGIGRTFSYGGAHNVVMYNENEPLNENNDYSESNGDDKSTIHHFYHKLFKIGKNMNTNTAKELASRRIEFMKTFVKEFLEEWNAKY